MFTIAAWDSCIKYLLFAFAAAVGISRAGINITVALLMVMVIIRYIRQPFPLVPEKNLGKALIIFFITLVVSGLLGADPLRSGEVLLWTALKISPLLFAYVFLKTRNDIDKVIWMLALSLLLGSSIAIWQGLTGILRAKSFVGIMDFAGILGVLVPIMLVHGFSPQTSLRRKAPYLLALAAASLAMLYNGTRSVWLGVLLSFGLFVGLFGLKNKKVIVTLLIIVVSAGALIFSNPVINKRFALITDMSESNVSTMDRFAAWRHGWEVFKEHPVFGVGLGCMPANRLRHLTPDEISKLPRYGHHIHNNILQILAENGIVGLVGFCGLFATILVTAWRQRKDDRSRRFGAIALLSTTAFLFHGLFDYTFIISSIMYTYWFVCGLCYKGYKLENDA